MPEPAAALSDITVGISLEAASRLALGERQEQQLVAYSQLVKTYAKATDLFGPAVLKDWPLHLSSAARSAAALPSEARLLLDLGSGGGLPGVVVAILRPDLPVVLCERREKRATFLKLVCARLGLGAKVFANDVRRWPATWEKPDVVCAQAVAELETLLGLLEGVVAEPFVLLTRRPSNWKAPAACGPWRLQAQYDALSDHHQLVKLSCEKATTAR